MTNENLLDGSPTVALLRSQVERLRKENEELRHDLDKALANHSADLTAGEPSHGTICEEGHVPIKYFGEECPLCIELRADALMPETNDKL